MALLVVLVVAVVVVVLVVRAAARPTGAARGGSGKRPRAAAPQRDPRRDVRPVAPDDDAEFLREIARRYRRDDSAA